MTEFKKVNLQTIEVNLDNVLYAKIGTNKITLYFKSNAMLDVSVSEKNKLSSFEGNESTLYNLDNVEMIQDKNDLVGFVNGLNLVIKTATEKVSIAKAPAKRKKQVKKTIE